MNDSEVFEMLCRQVVREVTETCGPVRRIRATSGDVTLEVEWPAREPALHAMPAAPPSVGPLILPAPPATPEVTIGPPPPRDEGVQVRAPLVGTFFQAPEPGARPFVAVGDVIGSDEQIGIIEAMKLMNPVLAETTGRVVEILVADGTPVEYDQPLIVIAPVG